MALGAFDLFSVGIGPSSSHTVGPMRAAATFVRGLERDGLLSRTARVRSELFGSLGATGQGHGSRAAVVLGLLGEAPEHVDTDAAPAVVARARDTSRLALLGRHEVAFSERDDVVLNRKVTLPEHPNGMRVTAYDENGAVLVERTFFSVGGGFVVEGDARTAPAAAPEPFPYASADELLAHTRRTGLSISEVVLANECVHRTETEVRDGLLHLWSVMQECVRAGCAAEGSLPGRLGVRRRAREMLRQLQAERADPATPVDPLRVMDWVVLFALAVNEQNAAGGRIVTAPTNGAAGIVPAVLHYYTRFVPGADDDGVVRFLLTATAIGLLVKHGASLSGAEVGCQGEVGSACAMAAAGLAEVLGGTPEQVENAAEIGIEHNLGLTCDPVGGLVQIPCIERNGVASVKAVTAARLALRGDGAHHVSLDDVIRTLRDTGADMSAKYKETSRGGLAVNVIEC